MRADDVYEWELHSTSRVRWKQNETLDKSLYNYA